LEEANEKTPTGTAGYSSPGQMTLHYSPRTPVQLVTDWTAQEDERIGWIRFSNDPHVDSTSSFAKVTRTLSEHGDLTEIARHLFATLRELDELDLDRIVIDTCDEQGIGRAIMDRIRRAAARRTS
jgi:L-threonylcarbamoyladenylate synthase